MYFKSYRYHLAEANYEVHVGLMARIFPGVLRGGMRIVCLFFVFASVSLPRYFFRSRAIGACPATMDCVELWR